MTTTDQSDHKADLLLETAVIPWRELQLFFAGGKAIYIDPELDLIDVASQFAADNKQAVEDWITRKRSGLLPMRSLVAGMNLMPAYGPSWSNPGYWYNSFAMNKFQLDQRLLSDCHVLGKLEQSNVLLMDNAEVPWFILVPETHVSEIYQLDHQHQLELLNHLNLFSAYIHKYYSIDKLNIGAIGNIVKQLHLHIVGRYHSDSCWPSVVWGSNSKQKYTTSEIETITLKLENYFAGAFFRHNRPE